MTMDFDRYKNTDPLPRRGDFKDEEHFQEALFYRRKKSRELHKQFKEDLLSHFGVSDNPRASKLLNLLDKACSSREELFERFEELMEDPGC